MSFRPTVQEALMALTDEEWVTVVQQMSWYCRTRFDRYIPQVVAAHVTTSPDPEEWVVLRRRVKNARRRAAYQALVAERRAAAEAILRRREARRKYMCGYMKRRRNQSGVR